MQPDFHPRQQDAKMAEQWLAQNSALFVPVGQTA
jgi:hypothetical protein